MSLPRSKQPCSNRLAVFAPWCAIFLVALSLLGTQLTADAVAQDSAEMSATYGRGVHAFFGSQLVEAEQLFSQVAQAGSTDPRVYYFRAMIRLQMGRQHEAEEDMKIGAAFEARDPGRRHSIGLALQRIQGPGRRTLERFRREGRLDRVQRRRQQTRQRYEQLERRGPQVLRRETPVELDSLAVPAPATPPAHVEVPPVAAPSDAGEEAPALATPPAEDNLPTPSPEPAPEDDLFGDPTPQPANTPPSPAEPMAEPESSEPADDLFGDPAPSEEEPADDLFGDVPAEDSEPPMTEEPASEEPAVEESPLEETESSEPTDDLFGDSDSAETSSDSATEEDPFGDAPAEETESTEEPAEDSSEVEDLFGAATPQQPAPQQPTQTATLKEIDRVNSGKLFGILGRVVGSAVPWRNIQLPIGASPTAETAEIEGIALGPDPTSSEEVTPASAETPVESPAGEDLFGSDAPADSSKEKEAFDSFDDDPFGEPFEDSEPAMESDPADILDEQPSDLDEDLFGFLAINPSLLLA